MRPTEDIEVLAITGPVTEVLENPTPENIPPLRNTGTSTAGAFTAMARDVAPERPSGSVMVMTMLM